MRQLRGSEIIGLSGGQAVDVAQQLDQAREQLRRVTEAMTELAETEITGGDESGMVTATVTGVGTLRSVYVSPHAMREFDNVALAAAARDAIQAARGAAATTLTTALSGATGEPVPELAGIELPEDPLAEVRKVLRG